MAVDAGNSFFAFNLPAFFPIKVGDKMLTFDEFYVGPFGRGHSLLRCNRRNVTIHLNLFGIILLCLLMRTDGRVVNKSVSILRPSVDVSLFSLQTKVSWLYEKLLGSFFALG